MNRRELLRALPALPFIELAIPGGEVDTVKLERGATYMVFANIDAVDGNTLVQELGHIGIRGAVHFVIPRHGHTVQDEVVFYKLTKEEESCPRPSQQ